MHLVHEVISVNGDVTVAPDHVLDQGVHALMHLVREVLSVNGVVIFAPDHVLDQGVHALMHFVHGGNGVK